MLIEAQSQKLISEHVNSITAQNDKPDHGSMEVDDSERKDPVKEEVADVEMKEADEKPPEEAAESNENDDKLIDIDPKTFCKLGHFHLLLEDYAKGKNSLN